EPQFIQGIMRDITQRKRAEEALQVSEERFRLLLDSTAEAIYGIDLRGNCTFANATCLRMLGYTDPAQVLGKDMHNLMHHTQPDGSPYPVETSPIYQVFAQSEAVHADDEVFWRADGTSFPVEYWAHPVCQEGSVFGAVVTFIDITERKQAEAKIRQTTARAMLLAEVSHTLAKAGSELPGVLESVARQIASQLGDACGILLLSDDEQVLKPVGLYHVDAEALAALRHRLAAVPLRVTDEFLRPVIQAGQPVLLLEVTPEQLRAWFAPSPHPAAERFSPRSISLVPLRLQDHIVGLLGVARPGQPYTADDQLLLQELADRVALAIANAHLLELARQELAERRRAEEALREHESRYRRLLEQAADPPVPESPRSP
ncbi:MAG: PAS domain S-box protein, partial [Anaerolineales bacterium]